ncbi:MAG: Sjogren's syndrome/scleroderma autoantigen 1 family protein [Candidatus Thorarchaeota archaeon]
MADLLRSGNTMLNIACPVCNNPIFRNKNGDNFCPTCERNVLIVDNSAYQENIIKEDKHIDKNSLDISNKNQFDSLNKLKLVIYEKLDEITQKLQDETQLRDIEVYTKILLNCLNILDKINFIK